MLLHHRRAFSKLIYSVDVVVLYGGALAASIVAGRPLPTPPMALIELSAGAVAWTFLARRPDLYRSRRTATLLPELWQLVQLSVLSMGAILVAHAAVRGALAIDVALAMAIAVTAMTASRLIIRSALQALRRRGMNTRNVLFVGRGETAHKLAAIYQDRPSYGFQILGDVTFTGEQDLASIPGVPVLGSIATLQDILHKETVDEVVLCPSAEVWSTEVRSVLRFLESAGLNCRVSPDFLGLPADRTSVSMTGDVPTFSVRAGFEDTRFAGAKRAIDIMGAGVGLLLLAPVLTAIAVAIKLTSQGPALFQQARLGLHCRPFTLFKFRSMVADAEALREQLSDANEQSGPVFKLANDPRVTAVGRFLRRYSLDELPQLLNVLRGDMSLVGPRPPLASEVREYDWWQRRRLSVRPGLTCIWQVSGRNAISFDRWMELDMQYIDGWSLGLDLRIIAKTFREVFRGGGA